jgi:MFS family permease
MEATLQTGLNLRTRARFIGLLAGFSAGVLNAIVARLLMRGIALLMFGRGSFSLGGTAVIFMFGALVGPLFGLLYHSTLYKIRAPDLVKGLLFGLVLLVTLQVPVLFILPEFRAELMAVGMLGFSTFTVMNFSFVFMLAGLVAWLEKTWPRDAKRQKSERVATMALRLLALSGFLLLFVEIVGRPLGLIE